MVNNIREEIHNYISQSWKKAVMPKNYISDFVLPFNYVPPCLKGDFKRLFYWDTYFTNIGLILDSKVQLALQNTENLFYALDYHGCVPNYCNSDGAFWCSQPPFLFLMVKDIFNITQDIKWLEYACSKLEKEYNFWQSKRKTANGLSQYRYNVSETNKDKLVFYSDYVADRLFLTFSNMEEKIKAAFNFIAEAESGEDFTLKYNHKALNYNNIDLNSLLWGLENTLSEFFNILNNKEKKEHYRLCADKRLNLLNKYCYDKNEKLYFDYDFKNNMISGIHSSASFYPYFMGFAKNCEGIKKLLSLLEYEYGITSCEKIDSKEIDQWAFPNAWAPHNFIAVQALQNIGLYDDAERIANKFMASVEKSFMIDGKIWEKYDAVNGGATKHGEKYGLITEMLGWTAGTYQYFYNMVTSKR